MKNKKFFGLFLLYSLINIIFSYYHYNFYLNYLKPLFWLIFLLVNYKEKIKNINTKNNFYITIIVSLIFVILYYLEGFFLGFTKSPLNHSLLGFMKNLIIEVIPILGLEYMRYKMLKPNRHHHSFIILFTTLIILNEINIFSVFAYSKADLFKYITSKIIPSISSNLLFNYLSLNSNYYLPITIKIINQIAILLFPIFPYCNWFIKGSFSIIKTVIIFLILKHYLFSQKNSQIKMHQNTFATLTYALTLIFSTSLVFFMLGLFKYEPIAILSNSMFPKFERGDLVIYEKNKSISKGSIIVYQKDSELIVHRVVDAYNDIYITKGDANNIVDKKEVLEKDIKGVYKFHLKYLGYPSIWLQEFLNEEMK